jgi:hypothetical protein
MKNLLKISGYTLTTIMVLLVSQFSVFAANDPSNQASSLTGGQVIGGLAVLLLVILLPLMKASHKRETN